MDEILRVIDVNDDFGNDDQEIKDAVIGKNNQILNSAIDSNQTQTTPQPSQTQTTQTTPHLENPFLKNNIETL